MPATPIDARPATAAFQKKDLRFIVSMAIVPALQITLLICIESLLGMS